MSSMPARLSRALRQLPRALRNLASPAERYKHARLLHGVRVSLAMLTSILVTSGIDIPHGIWASVSLLVVIGGLQHHGNIRQRAFERALGTAIGAVLGLAWVAQYAVIGSNALTYALLSITAGICGYQAIGKGGYIALLTAITMCIVAGHGEDTIDTGLWRTANVMIGIVIALLFSFALPLHATYAWRYGLALNLRRCARILRRLADGPPMGAAEQIAAFGDLSARLVSLRGLMTSAAKECNIAVAEMENIQREHRALVSALEMLASAALPTSAELDARSLRSAATAVRARLLTSARQLRSIHPGVSPTSVQAPALDVRADDGERRGLRGPLWLLQQMSKQADRLAQMLESPTLRKGLLRR